MKHCLTTLIWRDEFTCIFSRGDRILHTTFVTLTDHERIVSLQRIYFSGRLCNMKFVSKFYVLMNFKIKMRTAFIYFLNIYVYSYLFQQRIVSKRKIWLITEKKTNSIVLKTSKYANDLNRDRETLF